MKSFEELYYDRCFEGVPHFWNPQPISYSRPLILNDEDIPVGDWGIESCIEKILALGLNLELPVGEFVNNATNRDLPDIPILKLLLKSNVRDEASHYQGFADAVNKWAVPFSFLGEASRIAEEWVNLYCHPLEAAQALETGVFLVTLGFLRLAGGASLSDMSYRIAQDEYRHVATNRSLLQEMGYPTYPPFMVLVDRIIDWVFDGLSIPSDVLGQTIDKDFFRHCSHQLMSDGRSRQLNDLVFYVNHNLPFEIGNQALYSRHRI